MTTCNLETRMRKTKGPGCQAGVVGYVSEEDWANYVRQVAGCDDDAWRQLVQRHDLAQLRVHQALAHLARHHQEG